MIVANGLVMITHCLWLVVKKDLVTTAHRKCEYVKSLLKAKSYICILLK